MKKFNTDKKALENEILGCFSLLLITGHEFSREDPLPSTRDNNISSNSVSGGVSGSGKKQRFELVFNSVREAKMFCFAVYSVDRDASIMVRYSAIHLQVSRQCLTFPP